MSNIKELANVPEISFIENMSLQETEELVRANYTRIFKELTGQDAELGEADAKNLFVRDSKRRDYYLITVRGDKRVDLKQFRQQNQTRSLSFASAEELGELLGLIPGAVTPLGLLNDGDRRVSFYLDASFCRPEAQKIGVHPNDNTATLWLQVEDLLRLIRAHGNPVHVVPI